MKGWQYIEKHDKKMCEICDALDEVSHMIMVYRRDGDDPWQVSSRIVEMLLPLNHAIWEMNIIDVDYEEVEE